MPVRVRPWAPNARGDGGSWRCSARPDFSRSAERSNDDAVPLPDLRDDEFWRRYLITCAVLAVKPVSFERACELVAEWSRVIAAATMH